MSLHVHSPETEGFCAVNYCPTCERMRRMYGFHVEWYGTTWTCAGCGEQWADGEQLERPFSRGWRRRSVEWARDRLASIGVQA